MIDNVDDVGVEHANTMIHERSENESELSGMGRTATVVLARFRRSD